jgi:hypothetical protein
LTKTTSNIPHKVCSPQAFFVILTGLTTVKCLGRERDFPVLQMIYFFGV